MQVGQRPAPTADGTFDSALLPGGVRVTEERPHVLDATQAWTLAASRKFLGFSGFPLPDNTRPSCRGTGRSGTGFAGMTDLIGERRVAGI